MCKIMPSLSHCGVSAVPLVSLKEVFAMRPQSDSKSCHIQVIFTSCARPQAVPASPAKVVAPPAAEVKSTVSEKASIAQPQTNKSAAQANPPIQPQSAAPVVTPQIQQTPTSANIDQQNNMLARMEASGLAAIEMQARSTELTNKLGALKSAASVRSG